MIDKLLNAIKEFNIKPELEVLSKTSDLVKYKIRAPEAIINDKI